MNYSLLSPEALSALNVLTSKDDSLQQHSSNGDIEHHIVTTSMKTEQDSFVSCSQGGNPLGTTMVSMTGVANHHPHAATVPGNIVTMTASPNTLAEQLLVAVQNMNGNPATLDSSDDGKMTADVGMASLNSPSAAVGPQLASILGLAGLPQVAALAGIPGLANLSVVGQLAAAAQVVQAAANNANGGNGNITLAPGNAQQQTMQQVTQLNPAAMHHASTPQFILAGGQPIQGIQGAQLLIPTSSGVATQQIITIPVTQMMTNQMVQFVANNGQVLTTSLANLQAFNQSLSLANPQTASTNANDIASFLGSGGTVHSSPVISSGTFPGLNNQVTALPQILTNAAGQVIAITPQLFSHQMISNPANNIPVSAASLGTMHMSHQQQHHQVQQQQHHQAQQQQQQQQQQHQQQQLQNHCQSPHSEKEHSPIPHLNGTTITIAQKPTSSVPITSLASSPMSSSIISSLSSTPMNTISSGSLTTLTSALALQPQAVQSSTGQQLTLSPSSAVMVAANAAHLSSVQAKAQSSTQCISPQQQRLQHGSPGSISSSSSGTVSALTQTVMTQSVSSTTPSSTLENTVALINQSISRREADSFLSSADTISNTEANIVDGINLEEIKEFAKVFKIRRLSLGLTQTQVGQALSATEGPSYSQSAICRFEKLDITPKSAQKIKPVLERWMKEAEERYKNGDQNLTDFIGSEPSKKRKRRTSFTPTALEILNQFFEKNTHPSGSEMTELAERLNYDREVVRVWFCNKRQALKNTIKRLKGGMV